MCAVMSSLLIRTLVSQVVARLEGMMMAARKKLHPTVVIVTDVVGVIVPGPVT